MTNQNMFTWVATYKEIVNYLSEMKDRQSELIDLLKEIGVTNFGDLSVSGDIELDEIDPFTFFSYLNKYGTHRRVKLLQAISKRLSFKSFAEDDLGLPSAQAQKVWFFPWKKDRNNNEIEKLWAFFFSAIEKTITNEQFEDILTINNIGKTKLTEALFYIDPEHYLPIDSPMRPFLNEVIGVETEFSSFDEYKYIIDQVKTKSNKPLYELSFEGWEWNKQRPVTTKDIKEKSPFNSVNYWLYSPGANASKWEEFYQLGIMGLGWEALGDLNNYKSKTEIAEKLQELSDNDGSKKNNATANYDFKSRISLGDIIIVKKGRGELIGYGVVTSDYFYDENRTVYKKCRSVDWKKKGSWKLDFSLAMKTLTYITDYKTEHPDYNFYYQRLMAIMEGEKEFKLETPMNSILYGPPGTGKTFNTIKKAAEIIERRVIDDFDEAMEIFNDNIDNRIQFITFHQNFSYEEFIQGIRPDVTEKKNMSFERKDGIFTKIAVNALFEYYKEYYKLEKSKSSDMADAGEVYLDFIEGLKSDEAIEFETINGSTIYLADINENNNIIFRHDMRSRDYLVSSTRLLKLFDAYPSIDKIKNINEDIREIIGGCNATVYWVALKAFINFHSSYQPELQEKTEDNFDDIDYERKKQLLSTVELNDLRQIPASSVKNYVIVIDEINRANISRVFGELITLIEQDKRSHGKIPLRCILPSGEKFIVPSNLYIIGTMNTADKSIALLDIALRRRFFFESMFPLYEIEGDEIFDADILQSINKQIIERKGHDYQIGHSYFMNDNIDIIERMNNYIIPLLLEYFMNDENEVRSILINAGMIVNRSAWPLKIDGIK